MSTCGLVGVAGLLLSALILYLAGFTRRDE